MFRFVNRFPFTACPYYIINSRIVNINKLYLLLFCLNRRLIAYCSLCRLTASVTGSSGAVGLVCKPVFLTVAFKLLFLLLQLICCLVKAFFVAESVKRGTFTLWSSDLTFKSTLIADFFVLLGIFLFVIRKVGLNADTGQERIDLMTAVYTKKPCRLAVWAWPPRIEFYPFAVKVGGTVDYLLFGGAPTLYLITIGLLAYRKERLTAALLKFINMLIYLSRICLLQAERLLTLLLSNTSNRSRE